MVDDCLQELFIATIPFAESLALSGYAHVADYEFANQWFEILDYELKFKTTHNIF